MLTIIGKLSIMIYAAVKGRIAQLGEHLPYKQGVTGSSPVSPTSNQKNVESWSSWFRMPACHAGGRGFESRRLRQ